MRKVFPYTLNVNGRLIDLSTPQVMGILNVTPDSFYAPSRQQSEPDVARRVEQIREEGGAMIDIGAYSSRPGAGDVSCQEEIHRLRCGLSILRNVWPDAVVSVDTFRADVARMCVEEYGVGIINDISGGIMDPHMFDTVARLRVPYILTHMQGTPSTMQNKPYYDNLVEEVFGFFARRVELLHESGVCDVVIDPGFGFGKTLAHNYELMAHLEEFHSLNLPILVGISRKSMIYRLLNCEPEDALNGTTVLNTIALIKGAHILRVHDVRPCVEAIRIIKEIDIQG